MTTDRHCRLASLAILGLICLMWHAGPVAAQASPEPTQMILNMLDYVAVDYAESVQDGAVLDQSEYEEQLGFVQQAQTMLSQLPARMDKPGLLRQAEELVKLIQDKRPGPDVASMAQQLRWNLIRAYQVEVAPKGAPDLRSAASLYQSQCGSCHGPQGQGDGPAAASLEPRPSNFHDRQRLDQRSIYGLYSTITLGVQGTAMASFRTLKEDERWALAFYVSSLVDTEAERARGAELWESSVGRAWFPDLASVATATANNVKAQHGDDALRLLAFLRSRPEVIAPSHEPPLARSSRFLRDSLETYRSGQRRAAQELAVSAYLDGFELVEASLDTVDRRLRMAVESEMMRYRTMLKNGEPIAAIEAQADRLQGLVAEARRLLEGRQLSAGASFVSAFVIVLREGLEAILILAAIFALLTKAGRRDTLPYVHAGWIGALTLGGGTWLVASYVIAISGATREVTEGVTALVAAAVLLYVGFWMHSKAYADRWHTFLQSQLRGALSARTMWALGLVSFLAVYREVFEVVLFYEALWLQAAPAYVSVFGGLLTAAVALVGLAWLILHGSIRLRLSVFFAATSVMLALLAVVFVGKGIAALQEAGSLPVNPVRFPALPALGLYPNLQGLVLQALVIGIIAGVFTYTHYAARESR